MLQTSGKTKKVHYDDAIGDDGAAAAAAAAAELFDSVAPVIWKDRCMVQAWFQGAGHCFLRESPIEWKQDREIFLWMRNTSAICAPTV